MQNRSDKEGFSYTYSAGEQEEIAEIRKKYLPHEEDKMEQLRRLDAGVTRKGMVVSLIVGVLSTLILGIGMCCCMVFGDIWFIPGIVVGVLGIIGIVLAYPLYMKITQKERERIAPEILRLTEELMKQ